MASNADLVGGTVFIGLGAAALSGYYGGSTGKHAEKQIRDAQMAVWCIAAIVWFVFFCAASR